MRCESLRALASPSNTHTHTHACVRSNRTIMHRRMFVCATDVCNYSHIHMENMQLEKFHWQFLRSIRFNNNNNNKKHNNNHLPSTLIKAKVHGNIRHCSGESLILRGFKLISKLFMRMINELDEFRKLPRHSNILSPLATFPVWKLCAQCVREVYANSNECTCWQFCTHRHRHRHRRLETNGRKHVEKVRGAGACVTECKGICCHEPAYNCIQFADVNK